MILHSLLHFLAGSTRACFEKKNEQKSELYLNSTHTWQTFAMRLDILPTAKLVKNILACNADQKALALTLTSPDYSWIPGFHEYL